MYLTDSGYESRVRYLLNPLEVISDNFKCKGDNINGYVSWEEVNKTIGNQPCIMSAEGDFQYNSTLEKLSRVLTDLKFETVNLTFEEIIIDIATMEDWKVYQLESWYQFLIPKLTLIYAKYISWNKKEVNCDRVQECKKLIDNLDYLKNIQIDDWAQELRKMLDYKHPHYIETWT